MAAVVKTTSQRIYVTNELTPSFAPQNAKTITHRAMKQYQNRKVNLKFEIAINADESPMDL